MAIRETNTRITITLPKDLLDELDELASNQMLMVNKFITKILIQYIAYIKKKKSRSKLNIKKKK